VWPFFRLCLCNKVKVVEAAAKIREMQIVKKLQKQQQQLATTNNNATTTITAITRPTQQ